MRYPSPGVSQGRRGHGRLSLPDQRVGPGPGRAGRRPASASPSAPSASATVPGLLLEQLPEGGQIVALCDCNLPRAEAFKAAKKGNWKTYQHYQEMLDRKDIDAVIVGHRRIPAGAALHPCLPGGKGHLRREAPDVVHPRRPRAGQRRAQARPRLPGGHPAALDGHEPHRLRVGSQRRPGQGEGSAGAQLPQLRSLARPAVSRRGGAGRAGLGRVAQPGRRRGRTTGSG